MQMQQIFQTFDVYTAAAITVILRIEPTYKVENGRTIFLFPRSESIHQALNDFNAGIELNSYEYAQTIKRLRAEMLSRRNGGSR